MRTIRVTGKGQLKLRPDTTRITLTLCGTRKDYSEALRVSSEQTERLHALLETFGFTREDLKTLSFRVDTEYESYQENGAWLQRLLGYRFDHALKLEFPSDDARLGRILYELANSELEPELRLSFTVSEPEKVRNELLGRAVADAREKAAVLAQAAGLTLGEIQNVDYAIGEPVLEVRPMERMLMANASGASKASYDLNIEPDDIELNDSVTVIWEIL